MLTRRTATVTMSAPEALWALAITACELYFPLPMISRDLNARPAMTSDVSPGIRLASTHKIHDLDAVAVLNECLRKEGSPENLEIVLDSHAARIDCQFHEQLSDRQRLVEFVEFTVERDAQGSGRETSQRTAVPLDSQGKPLIQRGLRQLFPSSAASVDYSEPR
jgi:hypothetical protein